ncbi:MAG TPA: response regulator [Alphaproteobacteria bacterium]|jgi:two-component system chemotaxis response regulator CheY|nr:response regulator [Alphaproteobacteria bacterium]
MKLIDISRNGQQADFLSSLEQNTAAWAAREVKIADLDNMTSAFLGQLIATSHAATAGAVLLEAPASFFIVFPAEEAARFDDVLANHADAGVTVTSITPALIAPRLAKPSGKNARGFPPSILHRHRASRDKNVMQIVDDDLLICAALTNVLKPYGECLVAQNTNLALEHYLRRSPDCVFVDLHLEGETGLEFMNAVLSHDPDAHIIMLTSDASASNAIAAKNHGAKSFITKPLAPNRIEYELFRSPTFRRYC